MNLVWFGVVTVVAVEIGLLTPPFGLSVFVIKSTLNDPRISLGDIFRGTAPFTLIMFAVLVLLLVFPQISLVLLK
jgi:TRAP-type C4-dicarboxylate transport system permease large subunit